MNRKLVLLGALLGALAIILGAFGAHGLRTVLSENQLATFETGVRYQMYHALFLLFVASLGPMGKAAKTSILYLVLAGVLFFSGSIYLLATNGLSTFDFTKIALLTPLGGLLLIAAWGVLFVWALRHWKDQGRLN